MASFAVLGDDTPRWRPQSLGLLDMPFSWQSCQWALSHGYVARRLSLVRLLDCSFSNDDEQTAKEAARGSY